MNTLKSLLVALFVVGLIACSSNPTDSEEEQEFKPYQVGTFMVTAPDSADWIGSTQQKAVYTVNESETDTITITDTTDYSIDVSDNKEHGEGIFDININFHNTVSSDFFSKYDEFMPNERFKYQGGGPHGTNADPRIYMLISYDNCHGGYDDGNPKWLRLLVEPDNGRKLFYRFDVSGIDSVVTDLSC